MKKAPNYKAMFAEIERERGIKEADLVSALKDALMSAAKKRFPNPDDLEVIIENDGSAKIFDKIKGIEVTPSDFGRLAAQTAKQVILQRIREAEKQGTFDEFTGKIGEIANIVVQCPEYSGYLVNIGKIETFLSNSEVIPGETLMPQERVKVIIKEVKKTSKGPLIVISRTDPNFIKKLFEMEIPEIKQGILEIKAISREPGKRTKIAVFSNDSNIGAVGTCIGPMGNRIQNITKEIKNERIDVIEWTDKAKTYIANALSPAKHLNVKVNEEQKSAQVIVPEKELSLAIGRDGQNVRLAVRLTGYRIDIISEEKLEEFKKSKEGK